MVSSDARRCAAQGAVRGHRTAGPGSSGTSEATMFEQRPAVVAQLSVRRGREAVDFYRAAFGAVEVHRVGGTDDEPELVSQLAIESTTFWVSDESPEHQNPSPETVGGCTTRLLLVVYDPDVVVARA